MAKKKKVAEVKKEVEQTKREGTHPIHPRCPKCGKAMYKTMEKGKAVKKTDPWAFCRSEACELCGVDQSLEGDVAEDAEEDNVADSTNEVEEAAEEVAEEAAEEVAEESTKRKVPKKVKAKKAVKKEKVTKKEKPAAKKEKAAKKPTKKETRLGIRAMLAEGVLSHSDIAEKLGCSRKLVRNVRNEMQDEGAIG